MNRMRRMRAGAMPDGKKISLKTIKRLLTYIKKYRLRFILVIVCILLSAVTGVIGSMYHPDAYAERT